MNSRKLPVKNDVTCFSLYDTENATKNKKNSLICYVCGVQELIIIGVLHVILEFCIKTRFLTNFQHLALFNRSLSLSISVRLG